MQIDTAPIIDAATGVEPGNNSAYGFLILVMMLVIFALGWLSYYLMKRREKDAEKREEQLEKTFQITQTQQTLHTQLDSSLQEVKAEQKVHSSQLQTLLNRP